MRRLRHFCLVGMAILPSTMMSGCARLPFGPPPPSATPQVDFGSLLREMADLGELSLRPNPNYRTLQFSSYDRSSGAPYTSGWFANSDGFGNEPTPNVLAVLRPPDAEGVGYYLLAEVDGPGALTRTWTTHPWLIDGYLRVLIDGNDEPLYFGPADRFMHDRLAAFGADGVTSAGYTQYDACYLPIPFSRGLRIEWIGKLSVPHFYHIQVRSYDAGTVVRSFTPEDLTTWRAQLLETQRRLFNPQPAGDPLAGQSYRFTGTIAPGESMDLLDLQQMGAIEELALVTAGTPSEDLLRDLVLEIYFDSSFLPQVEVPVGAFFSSAPGYYPFQSLPLTVEPEGTMVSRFVMPFQYHARAVLRNYGQEPHAIGGWLRVGERTWDPDRSLHFFAKWHIDIGLLANTAQYSTDLPFLLARGVGRLVGVATMLFNPTNYVTGVGGWWGEGDEKIWVDDDTFPSIFGTGTEDFFNHSWSDSNIFSEPYCGQPMATGPTARGHVVNHRWMMLDSVPFAKSIDFYLELQNHSPTPGFDYARTLYFYATPRTHDNSHRINPTEVAHVTQWPPDWEPLAWDSPSTLFIQAENALVEPLGGATRFIEGDIWARSGRIGWQPTGDGDRLAFLVNLPTAGTWNIRAVFARTPESGRMQLRFDGQVLHPHDPAVPGNPPLPDPVVDLYEPNVVLSRGVDFGDLPLAAGAHQIELEVVVDEGETPREIGIDFFWLTPSNGGEASPQRRPGM